MSKFVNILIQACADIFLWWDVVLFQGLFFSVCMSGCCVLVVSMQCNSILPSWSGYLGSLWLVSIGLSIHSIHCQTHAVYLTPKLPLTEPMG